MSNPNAIDARNILLEKRSLSGNIGITEQTLDLACFFTEDFSHSIIERDRGQSWAEGSLVQLANGTSKPIEQLSPATRLDPAGGDMVKTVDGSNAWVVGLMAGPELPKLLKLTVEVDSTVKAGTTFTTTLTEGHSVMIDPLHLLLVSRLAINDHVQTIYGQAIVRGIDWVDYSGSVWNLFLASEEFVKEIIPNSSIEDYYRYLSNSMLGLQPRQHLIFVDGVVSGDWLIQKQLVSQIRRGVNFSELI